MPARQLADAFFFAAFTPAAMICAVTLAAALVSTDLLNAVMESVVLFVATFVVATLHVVILAIPLFYLCLRFGRISRLTCYLSGFVLGVIPYALWQWPLWSSGIATSSSAGSASEVIQSIVDAAAAYPGWLRYWESVGMLGFSGLVGGMTFWHFIRNPTSPNHELHRDATRVRARSAGELNR